MKCSSTASRRASPQANRIFGTIWDGDGIDTYELSNYTHDLKIDLARAIVRCSTANQLASLGVIRQMRPAATSLTRCCSTATRVHLIENATGGTGDDTINGNIANNVLTGNAGDDQLSGVDGNDTLIGGAGADELDGGSGFDFASYQTSTAGVWALLTAPGLNMGDAAGDSYSSIEGLIGSAFSDLLLGNNHANILKGLGGDDFLFGLDGDDVLVGGAGGDYHDGGSGFAPPPLDMKAVLWAWRPR